MVSLTITQDGNPRADVAVYFLAADNALVAKVSTNAQGVASATMGLGGSVTAIDSFSTKSSGRDLRTFVGVKPGDNLELQIGGTAAQSVATNFTLDLPTDAFASSYQVSTNCGDLYFSTGGGSGSGSGVQAAVGGTSTLYGCGAMIDILVQTFDGGGLPLGAIYKSGVALAEGGTVDLTAEPFVTPVPTQTITWSNIPAAYTELYARGGLASPKGYLTDVDVNPAPVAAGATTATITRPTVTGGIAITRSEPGPSNSIGRQTLMDWAPQTAAPVAVDLANALLGTYTTMPSVSAATRTVTWTASAGATPDFAWATLSANRLVGASNTSWDWSIVVPYATTTFTLPVLPTEIAELNFVATDDVNIDDLVTAKVPGGYDAVRATILSSSLDQYATGASGRIVYETMDFAPTNGRIAPPLRSWTNRAAYAPRR